MAKVSVPEKTLEHWSSLYLAYRYRSRAAMWWPATGVDIDIRWLPNCPGKAVQLELKTSIVAGANLQDVKVNLGQLWDYDQLPPGQKPFYVFPWPDWTGDLEAVAIAANIPPSELAFSRSGQGWWFADWLVVLTTDQVASVLAPELAAHGSPSRKNASCRLVRFDLTASATAPTRLWGSGAPEPTCIPWRQFWSDLQMCGRDGWSQLIRLPMDSVTTRDYDRAEIVEMLRRVKGTDRREWRDTEMATLAPFASNLSDGPDVFRIIDDPIGGLEPPSNADRDGDGQQDLSDRRQLTLIEAGALGRRRD
ncbi:hypothetical protein F4692_003157 [Nocardioides cavernae]|uniref:DUF4365 domain-containing protein n=1 Tax=Nocardioides cavernae TaxID=1921566 RepID=A0A7Y9H521_9ACTN|nr:hypothetical protein [Nocardioides cavernae]NYE38012.1 hypothetical protein [Nocardioides cavernae]